MVFFTPTKVLRYKKYNAEDSHYVCADAPFPEARHFPHVLIILTRQSRWSVKSTNPHFDFQEIECGLRIADELYINPPDTVPDGISKLSWGSVP